MIPPVEMRGIGVLFFHLTYGVNHRKKELRPPLLRKLEARNFARRTRKGSEQLSATSEGGEVSELRASFGAVGVQKLTQKGVKE